MKKKKQKPKYDAIKTACRASRERELSMYGRLVGRKPSRAHKSKRDYDRKRNKHIDIEKE